MLLKARNWIRWHVLRKNPVCPECGDVMIKRGYPRDFMQEFKCVECKSDVL